MCSIGQIQFQVRKIYYYNNILYPQINSIFGKTLEDTRKYKNIKLVTSIEYARKYLNRPQLQSFTIISSNLVCLDLVKAEVKLNKPIYTGMVSL